SDVCSSDLSFPPFGKLPRQVTNGNFPNGGNEWSPTRADWTPDGKYLIISANRHPESDHAYFDTEVYEFSVADGALRALTNWKGPDNSPEVDRKSTRLNSSHVS